MCINVTLVSIKNNTPFNVSQQQVVIIEIIYVFLNVTPTGCPQEHRKSYGIEAE